MKKIFILFAVIGCLAISFTVGIFGNTESVIDDIDGLIRQYEEAGALSKDTSHDEVTIATADGKDISVPDCESEIHRCLTLDLADTQEEAIHYMIQKDLLQREADAAGITVTDAEVEELIASQKKLMTEEPEVGEFFKNYFDSLGLTEEEYWTQYYEDYRSHIKQEKLRNEMYHSYLEDEVKKRLAELGVSPSPEEFAQILEKEQELYSPVIREGFSSYYQEYQEALFDKYHVTVVMV